MLTLFVVVVVVMVAISCWVWWCNLGRGNTPAWWTWGGFFWRGGRNEGGFVLHCGAKGGGLRQCCDVLFLLCCCVGDVFKCGNNPGMEVCVACC